MPEITVTELPRSEVKLEFVVSQEEARPYMEEAVRDLSTARPVPGFRPGKLPYQEGVRVYGEMVVMEQALERIVRAFYVKAILEKELNTVGSPSVNIDQLVAGQPIKFTVVAPIEPVVTKMPDLKACKVTRKETKVEDKHVDEAVLNLRKMRRNEVAVDRAATGEDLVIIDLEMTKDRVALEGGTGRDYRVYLAEDQYIPGFSKELVGSKKGDEKTFTLPFPAEHYQKHLAGQNVDFKATVKDVFELQLPEANEEFVKTLGMESVEQLRDKIKENLTQEANQKADESSEIELLDKLVDSTSFTEVPEILVNEEVRRMMGELRQGIDQQGMKWEDYLSSIKKDEGSLKLEFVPQAIRRIKTAVLIKAYAKEANIEIKDADVDEEIDHIIEHLRTKDQETMQRVTSAEYREYVMVQMRNRKTLEWIKEQCIEKK